MGTGLDSWFLKINGSQKYTHTMRKDDIYILQARKYNQEYKKGLLCLLPQEAEPIQSVRMLLFHLFSGKPN